MKKRRVILSSVAALLVGLMLFTVVQSRKAVRLLGRELLTIDSLRTESGNRNSPIDGFVHIGPSLYEILTTHDVPLNKIEVREELGDCVGFSWDITNSIIMESPNSQLCIRLRYDVMLNKYHIVGYTGSIE